MEDNRAALKAIKSEDKVIQMGWQRSSGNYKAAAEFIQFCKFGPVTMVELIWKGNQLTYAQR